MDVSGARKFLLFLLGAAMLFGGGHAWAATINVPGDQPTIQAAIDAALDGDTINIAAGTYTEVLSVNKQVSIVGAGISQVTIDVDGLTSPDNAGIYVSADNVSLQGFTLNGGGAAVETQPRYGVKFYAVSGGSAANILVSNVYGTGFDLLGASNAMVSNVQSMGNGGHGIQLCDCNTVTLSNITTSNNGWNSLSICTWGNYSPLGTSEIVLIGIIDLESPLQIEEGDYNNPGVPPAGDAVITYSTNLSDNADVTLVATDFAYAMHGTQDDSPDLNRIWFFQTLAEAEASVLSAPVGHFTGSDIYIKSITDLSQLYISPGGTIQAAIDAASSGDTINVAPGTYAEVLNINKSLNLQSSGGAASTILNGAMQLSADNVTVDGFTINNGATMSGENAGIYIVASTGGHTISANILNGPGSAYTPAHRGITFGYYISNTTVSNNTICDWNSGIYINPTNPAANLAFTGNTFCNNQSGVGSDGIDGVSITDNDFITNTEGWGVSNAGTDVQAHQNSFLGNTDTGIHNYGGNSVDATLNWWGDASGPSGGVSDPVTATVANGTGDEIRTLDNASIVQFDPWLVDTALPYADAGPDMSEPEGSVTLDGSNSYDPDGSIVSWDWLIEHPTDPGLNQTASGETVVLNGLTEAIYSVTLTVTDNDSLTDTDTMVLTIYMVDTDGDGISDSDETNIYGTNPLSADTDGDGLDDGEEINTRLTDPLSADTDGDGLDDGDEVNTHGTNPNLADTDNDGASDGDEIAAGTDPLDPLDFPTIPTVDVLYIHSNTTDDSTVFEDSSPSMHPVTRNGNVHHDGYTLFGSTVISYDGTGDYLSIPDSPDWDFGTGDFTIGLWVYFDSAPAEFDGILSTYAWGGASGYLLGIYEGHIQWSSPGTGWVDTGVAPVADDWTHLAAVRAGNTLTIYVNGNTAVSQSCEGLNFNSDTGIVIGRLLTTTNAYYFDGYMDEITISTGTAEWTADFSPPNHPDIAAPPPDTDSDGISDEKELNDYGTDPLVADTDADGINDGNEVLYWAIDWNTDFDSDGSASNLVDPDSDDDGLYDGAEILVYGTDPASADTDGDGMDDGDEVLTYGTDPLLADTDGDGLDDSDEILTYGTDPLLPDTDDDSISDSDEILTYGTNPLLADTDGDETNDWDEIVAGTDPNDPLDFPTIPAIDVLYIYSDTTEGSTIFVDSSPSSHTITANGNVRHGGYALFGSTAVSYDGTGDYLSIPASPDWNFGTWDFTISLWVYFDSPPAEFDGIFSTYNYGGTSGYLMAVYNGHIQWSSSGTGWMDTGVTPAVGEWTHLAVVRAGDTFTIYVNGSERVSQDCTGFVFDTTNGLVIGRLFMSTNAYYFDGYMDEITLSSGIARWTGNFTPPDHPDLGAPPPDMDMDGISDDDELNTYGTNPVVADTDADGINDGDELAYWGADWNTPFDLDGSASNLVDPDADDDGAGDGEEISAGTDPADPLSFPSIPASAVFYVASDTTEGSTAFVDDSLSAHTVTANGNVQHGGSALFGNTAISFDGTGDYLSVPNSPDWDFETGDFTIGLWVYFDSTPAEFDGIFTTFPWGGANGYLMGIYNGHIQWSNPGTGWVDTGVSPTVGQWTHLAAVRSGDTFAIYVNGNEAVSLNCAGLTFNSDNGLLIGRLFTAPAGWYFDGYMDEIVIAKGEALWTGSFTPPNYPGP